MKSFPARETPGGCRTRWRRSWRRGVGPVRERDHSHAARRRRRLARRRRRRSARCLPLNDGRPSSESESSRATLFPWRPPRPLARHALLVELGARRRGPPRPWAPASPSSSPPNCPGTSPPHRRELGLRGLLRGGVGVANHDERPPRPCGVKSLLRRFRRGHENVHCFRRPRVAGRVQKFVGRGVNTSLTRRRHEAMGWRTPPSRSRPPRRGRGPSAWPRTGRYPPRAAAARFTAMAVPARRAAQLDAASLHAGPAAVDVSRLFTPVASSESLFSPH